MQLVISRTLVDLPLVREFQETVIECRALRPSADLIPSLDQSEHARDLWQGPLEELIAGLREPIR